jgi:heme A synthase
LDYIRETRTLSTTAVGFIIIQSLIGAANVIWRQSDFILAIHFGVSLISFAAVFLLTLLVFEIDKKFKAETTSHRQANDNTYRRIIASIQFYRNLHRGISEAYGIKHGMWQLAALSKRHIESFPQQHV